MDKRDTITTTPAMFGETGLVKVDEDTQEPRMDSRDFCDAMGVNHNKWMSNILRKHQGDLEGFGILPFKKAVSGKAGQPATYTTLNKAQATFAVTLNRNTTKAVEAKAKIVAAFMECERRLLAMESAAITHFKAVMEEKMEAAEAAIKNWNLNEKPYVMKKLAEIEKAIPSVTPEERRELLAEIKRKSEGSKAFRKMLRRAVLNKFGARSYLELKRSHFKEALKFIKGVTFDADQLDFGF